MKNILKILFLFIIFACSHYVNAQTYGWMIRVNPDQDPDTANIGIMYPSGSGNLTGRMHFVSFETLADTLENYMALGSGFIDTVYVNAGDSLVLVTSANDTIYFESGGGSISDGDKGDITVSGSGATWTIDNGLNAAKIADGTVSSTEFQYINSLSSNAQTQLNNKAASGNNTDLTSIRVSNSGLGVKSPNPTYTMNIVPLGSDYTADRAIIFVLNNANRTINMSGNLTVPSDAIVSGTNTGDQDLSTVTDDRSFYDYGTTDMPTTSDDSIETTNVKYILFNGLTGGLNTKIEILKEGTIQFDIDTTSVAGSGNYILRAKPLQRGNHSNANFNLTRTINFFEGDSISDDGWSYGLNAGVNGREHDSLIAAYHVIESQFSLEGRRQTEWHKVFGDTLGTDWRVETYALDHGDSSYQTHAFEVMQHSIRRPSTNPLDDNVYFNFQTQSDDITSLRMLRAADGSDGVELYMHSGDDLFSISPYGTMPSTATMNVSGFDELGIKKFVSQYSNASSNAYCLIKNSASNATSNSARLSLAPNTNFIQSTSPYIEAYNSTDHGGLGFGTYNSGAGGLAERMRLTHDGKLQLGVNGVTHAYLQSADGIYLVTDYENNASDGSFHIQNSGTDVFALDDNGAIDANAYDATPPTGTPFGLIAHESDGDFISYDPALKVSVSDTASMLTNYVLRSGAETIYDVKTFNADPIIPDEAYGSGWNGSLEPPTKNAVYDKIETIGGTSSPTTISPSQLTADQDNYNPTGIGKATYVRLSSDSGMRAITGIADSTAGTLEKTIINIGTSYALYFPMDHPDSDAAHRFTSYEGDYVLFPGKSMKILYDVTSSRWRILTEYAEGDGETIYYRQSAASQTAGDHSDLGVLAIGSGTNTHTPATTTAPACYLLSTATNASWGYVLYFTKGFSQYTAYGSSHNYIEATVSFPVLSDGTDTYTTELQFTTSPTNSTLELNNTIAVRYSHGINSGKFELFCQDNAGSEGTPADLGVTVAANTLYKIRIEHDKSNSEARAYINGVYCGRVTNMPAAAVVGARIAHVKSVGTTARTCQVHNFSAGAIY